MLANVCKAMLVDKQMNQNCNNQFVPPKSARSTKTEFIQLIYIYIYFLFWTFLVGIFCEVRQQKHKKRVKCLK